MNEPVHPAHTSADPAEAGRLAILQHFQVEELQYHGQTDLLSAQILAGHGNVWGVWKTPKSISPGSLDSCARDINIAQRLRDFLAKEPEPVSSESLDTLVDEGVLLLTRLALVARLVPTGGRCITKNLRLKPSTIAGRLYGFWPKITARAIRRKAKDLDAAGLMGCLIEGDVREFKEHKRTRIELERLETLVALNVWADAPPLHDITQTTDPSGAPEPRMPEQQTIPYPPIPDEYMAAIGPRVIWIVRDLGPHLLRLLEALPAFLGTVDWSLSRPTIFKHLKKFISDHLQQHPWQDRMGQPVAPPFPLVTSVKNKSGMDVDAFEWPPAHGPISKY